MEGEAFQVEDTDMTLCRSWACFFESSTRHATEVGEIFENPPGGMFGGGATPRRNGSVQGSSGLRLRSDGLLDIVPLRKTRGRWALVEGLPLKEKELGEGDEAVTKGWLLELVWCAGCRRGFG